MKTDLKLVKIDVTHNWNEDYLKEINSGKVYDICLYDSNQVTHCCEITPSYWLVPLYSETENHLEDEQWEDFMNNNTLDPFYNHCSATETLNHIDDLSECNFEYEKSEDEKEYFEQFEEVEDDLRCNPVYN